MPVASNNNASRVRAMMADKKEQNQVQDRAMEKKKGRGEGEGTPEKDEKDDGG